MSSTAQHRRRRIAALEREILDEDEIRNLARRGILVPLSHAPSVPARPEMIAEMRARLARRVRVDEETPDSDQHIQPPHDPDHFDW